MVRYVGYNTMVFRSQPGRHHKIGVSDTATSLTLSYYSATLTRNSRVAQAPTAGEVDSAFFWTLGHPTNDCELQNIK